MIVVTSLFSKKLRAGPVYLRFSDGLVWTVGLTEEITLRFQSASALSGRCLSDVKTEATILTMFLICLFQV